jgi:hypothetical protein
MVVQVRIVKELFFESTCMLASGIYKRFRRWNVQRRLFTLSYLLDLPAILSDEDLRRRTVER